MDRREALNIIYALRNGMPPENAVSRFTVGREAEIGQLMKLLGDSQGSGSLLIQANSGSGKTHLLRFIKEKALEEGILIGSVVLDSSTEVKLSRMDHIIAAVFRTLEWPGSKEKGVRSFFDMLSSKMADSRFTRDPDDFWNRLASNWKWDASDILKSPALYIALRSWSCGGESEKDLIEDWLSYPWNYYDNRKILVRELVEGLHAHFTDPRPPSSLYNVRNPIFRFDLGGYGQCWDLFHDLQTLSKEAGLQEGHSSFR